MGIETIITLKMDNKVLEAKLPYSDCTGSELLELFCSLMIGQTFSPTVVKNSLEEVLENYLENENSSN